MNQMVGSNGLDGWIKWTIEMDGLDGQIRLLISRATQIDR